MSHELETDGNGRVSFAFNAKAGLPWHKLGIPVQGLQTAEEMLELARANYEVFTTPVFVQNDAGEFVAVDNRFATARISPIDGELQPFEVMTGRYTPIQNADVLDRALAVVGASSGEAVIDTLGVMFNGRQFFATLDLGAVIIDPEGINDEIGRFLVVKTSHDGTSPVVFANTDVRAVCNNTVRLAEREAKSVFRARHTPNADERIHEAQRVLGFSTKWAESFQAQAEELLAIEVTPGRFDRVLDTFMPEADADTDRKRNNRDAFVTSLKTVYGNERNLQRVGANGWALYNAYVEWADHFRKGTVEELATASMDESGLVSKRKVEFQNAVLALN